MYISPNKVMVSKHAGKKSGENVGYKCGKGMKKALGHARGGEFFLFAFV